jgi:hypothetical protein
MGKGYLVEPFFISSGWLKTKTYLHCWQFQTLFLDLKDKIFYFVTKDRNGDFTTFQDAINAVADNNTDLTIVFERNGILITKRLPSLKRKLTLLSWLKTLTRP